MALVWHRFRFRRWLFHFTVGFVLFTQMAGAVPVESDPPQNAPAPHKNLTVGLVLSGGGARGLAHIGVLKWFEENRIPVDYLSGTSMGGLVGGMYSMGMTPDQMQKFMNSVNWNETFSAGPTFDQLSYRRKEDKRNFQVDLEMGVRKGVRLPTGVSSAHYIGLMIDRLTLPYGGLKSFDDLPIPFRCLATDFVAAKPVVLKDGRLATAMRATMSIPGLFPPVEREGKTLVDGALLNNIPTTAMKELKPDITIAVDVGTPLGSENSVQSLFGIVQQSLTIMTIDNDRRNLRLADVIIAPELGELSLLDFSAIDKAIEIGYKAAAEKGELLRKFALDPADWETHLATRSARRKTAVPVPQKIEVAGVNEDAQIKIEEELQDFAGKPLDLAGLETRLTSFTGEGRYASLDYEVTENRQQQPVLRIRVREKTHAPPTLNFSLLIDGDDISAFRFAVGGRLTIYDQLKYGSEWRNDLRVGFSSFLRSEFLYPLSQKGWFVAPRLFYTRGEEGVFVGGQRLSQFQINRIGFGGDLVRLYRNSELRFGYEIQRIDADLTTGQRPDQPLNGLVDFARLRYVYDKQNSATVPTAGLRLASEGRVVFNSPGDRSSFPQVEATASYYKPIQENASLFLSGLFGTTFNKDAAPFQRFTLGGPFRLGAYGRDEFRGNHAFLATLGYQREIYKLPPLFGTKVYGVGWYDIGGAYREFTAPLYRQQISAGFIADTKLGPFSLIGAIGEGGRGKVYFSIGRTF
ncbi:MAG: patatin-like phospholipase family protein [Blastocatellia bacterium]|nr:patatin-like phospholipase family protein [Blastocatellia bacterium]